MVTNPFLVFKGAIKLCAFFGTAIFFILHHELISILVRNEKRKLEYFVRSNKLTSLWVMKFLNIQVDAQNILGVNGKLLVSNHLSYIDALVLFSCYPSLFVTSKEIRETFLLGKIAALGGCFFVERRKEKRHELSKTLEINEMKERLNQGFNVFLFPEGTSSDGLTVLPFKATFFQMALDANIDIQPVLIKYQGANQNLIPWYGDQDFLSHLISICFQNKIQVTLKELPTVAPQIFSDRFELSQSLHIKMKDAYEKY